MVGPTGRAIGIDMTPAMLDRARANALAGGYTNVEFYHSTIDQIPLPDGSVDCVISNCVLNLCPDKDRALRQIYRALKPGGKLAVSDMAWTTEPPESVRRDLNAIVGCIGGALVLDDYLKRLALAGFRDIHVERHPETARLMIELSSSAPIPGVENLMSVNVLAFK